MANHRKKTSISLPSLNKRQWIRIGAVAAALALVATGGIITRSFYASDGRSAAQQVTAYSATDPLTVSRGSARDGVRGMDGDTSYVTVKLDGQSRTVLGTDFTTVKSVLEAGNITLGPNDTVDPALDAEVDESTVITIETADSALETSEEPIAFNTVRKETSSLPEGTEQVESEDFCQRFKATLSQKDMAILELRVEGYTLEEIADRLGYKTHSAVVKRMEAIKKRFIQYEQESGR